MKMHGHGHGQGHGYGQGDLIRIKHFRTVNKRYYMYKVANEYKDHKGVKYWVVKHFNEKGSCCEEQVN